MFKSNINYIIKIIMYIDQFRKRIVKNKTVIDCVIDRVNRINLECDEKYYDAVQDNYDGFLVLVLIVAMKDNKNIDINGKVSYKLYFNIVNHLMPIIKIVHPHFHMIRISVKGFSDEKYENNYGIGCGLSCGVDSLCCIEDYYNKYIRDYYKLTHVTNFFAGATKNRKVYENKLIHINKYIEETDLEFLQVDTTFQKINNLEHQYFHTLRNLSVPLFFQKLFNKYYYASSFSYQNSKIVPDSGSITSTEPMLIPLLSTENCDLILHGAQYSRVRKTEIISNNELAQKYLDVCVHPSYYEVIQDKINCSKCFKCLRTCCTLDYYNCLDKFEAVFDIETYKLHKVTYLKKLVKTNPYDRELTSKYYYEDELIEDMKYNTSIDEVLKYIEDKKIIEYNKMIENQTKNDKQNIETNLEDNTEDNAEDNTEDNADDNAHNNADDNSEDNTEDNTEDYTKDNTKDNTEDNADDNAKDNTEVNYNISNHKIIPKENKIKINIDQKNIDEFNRSQKEDQIFRENQIFNDFLIKSCNDNIYNEKDTIDKVKKEINSSENSTVNIKIIENIKDKPSKIINKKQVDRYWYAFKKDWELISSVNQIRCIKDTIVKKNKNLHSSKLNDNEKRIFYKGKLFKLEQEQDNSGYYKIKI